MVEGSGNCCEGWKATAGGQDLLHPQCRDPCAASGPGERPGGAGPLHEINVGLSPCTGGQASVICPWHLSMAIPAQLGTRTAAMQGGCSHAQRLRPSTGIAAVQPLQRQPLPQAQARQNERLKCQQGCAGIKGTATSRHSSLARSWPLLFPAPSLLQ